MRRTTGHVLSKLSALVPLLVLLAFALLTVVPHSWHEEMPGRPCAVCQVSQMPSLAPATVLTVGVPEAVERLAPVPEPGGERTSANLVPSGRAPPA